MSPFIAIKDIPEKEIIKGYHARMIHVEGVTVAHFRVEAGSALPQHHHIHEQVTNIISGTFEMTVDGITKVCTAGDVVAIPSHVPHSAIAITDCYIVDVFCPVREDYR